MFDIKNINQCLHKLYLECIYVGIYNNINDDGDPSAKRSKHQLNKYNIGPQRRRETETTQRMSMLK